MRIGIMAAVVLSSSIALMPSAVAQMTPRGHAGEPPPSAAPASPQEPRAGMQGPSAGVSMSQMMRGPTSPEFYPTLIRISEPDPAERKRLEERAEQWMSEGMSLLSEGATALSASIHQVTAWSHIKGVGWYQSH